jgi:glycosyltransferase involved in cell wall biosynthesis
MSELHGTAGSAARTAGPSAASAPRRLLHVVPWFSASGGVQRYVREIAARQHAQGLDIEVLTTSAHGDAADPPYVRRVNAPLFVLRTPFAPAFRSAIENTPADLIHVHGPNPLVDWSVLGLERPYVYSLYNPFPAVSRLALPALRFGQRLCRWAIERAQGVAILDPDIVREPWVPVRGPVWQIPPGVDTTVFRPLGIARRREVLFVGHLRPEKGLHFLVEAVRRLPGDVGLRVLASIKYARGYALRERKRARRLLGSRLVWQTDPSDAEVALAFNETGCVAIPSTALESWNLVMLEAAACGAPVVRSDLPALSWATFALPSRAGDPADLARALSEALRRIPELSARALAASREFRWERTCERLGEFYREALAAAPAVARPAAPGGGASVVAAAQMGADAERAAALTSNRP